MWKVDWGATFIWKRRVSKLRLRLERVDVLFEIESKYYFIPFTFVLLAPPLFVTDYCGLFVVNITVCQNGIICSLLQVDYIQTQVKLPCWNIWTFWFSTLVQISCVIKLTQRGIRTDVIRLTLCLLLDSLWTFQIPTSSPRAPPRDLVIWTITLQMRYRHTVLPSTEHFDDVSNLPGLVMVNCCQ